MNKKIKIIDLLNKIANGKEFPKIIKFNDLVYEYKRITQGTGYVTEDYVWLTSDVTIDDWADLNNEVEIIEENNTKEIEELEIFNNLATDERLKINELIRAVNQLAVKLKKQ